MAPVPVHFLHQWRRRRSRPRPAPWRSSSRPACPSEPPVAPRRPLTSTHHGHERIDDYEWLRAKDDPEVRAYLEAENAWTEQQTAHLADLRQTIFDEIKARTLETDLSVPYPPARLLVLLALLRGQGVRRLLPGARRRRRLDPAPAGRGQHGRPARAARRGDPARPQRARRGARVLLHGRLGGEPRRPLPGLLHRHQRRRALHRAGQGPGDRRAAARRRRGRAGRPHLEPRRPRPLLRHRR